MSVRAAARALIGWVVPLAIVFVWELASRLGYLSPIFFPPPSRLVLTAGDLAGSGVLAVHLVATLSTVLIGFFLGGLVGFAAGLLLGSWPLLRLLLEPSLSAIYAVPKVALLPIFLALFGVGSSAVIGLVATSTFFYVWVYTMGAATRVPESHLVSARVFGASRGRTLWSIYLPATLPEAFVGLRVGVTVALLITLTSEYILGSAGLGYLIFGTRALGRYTESYVGILLAGILGLLLQLLVVRIGRHVMPWQDVRVDDRIQH